jgi:hypothetical protein
MVTGKKKKGQSTGARTNQSAALYKLKAAKALTMRMEGKTFEVIRLELGYATRQGAYMAVRTSLDAITREPAQELIKLDLERLDALWIPQYTQAQSGDVLAMNACMKLMERRAKLLGLDAPAKQDVNVSTPEDQARAISLCVRTMESTNATAPA